MIDGKSKIVFIKSGRGIRKEGLILANDRATRYNIFYNYYYKRISVKMIKRNNSNSHSIHSRDILTTFQTSILIYAPSFVTFINACLNIIM